MIKMSLLDMVQDILSDMDSDEVNDIDDTTESLQVAQIIKSCYMEMVSNRNWPGHKRLMQLEHAGDLAKPNYLKLPESLKELEEFKYKSVVDNGVSKYIDVKFKYPDEFLSIVNSRDPNNENVKEVSDFGGSTLNILTNQDPMYWTSFDDKYLVTDSYNKAVDTALQRSKTQVQAVIFPSWERSNDFVPDLPPDAFSALLEEAKSTCFLRIKQMPDQKAEQKASRQNRWLARKAWRAHGGVRYDDYGRKSRR